MNNGGEAADQMVREALQVTEVAIKLSALGIKNALALSLAYAKENPKVKGKTSLDRLLREGKELKIIALQSKDVGQFKELAKQYGVLFAVIKDKAQNEKVDVMFKAEDVAKEIVNAIAAGEANPVVPKHPWSWIHQIQRFAPEQLLFEIQKRLP